MCMWHCGIHYPFHVDVSTRSTFVPEHPVSATQDCDSLGDLAILQCKSLMVSCQNLFRTPIEIRKLFGIILRFLPWNLCIKMYLRIGELKALDHLLDIDRNNWTPQDEHSKRSNL